MNPGFDELETAMADGVKHRTVKPARSEPPKPEKKARGLKELEEAMTNRRIGK